MRRAESKGFTLIELLVVIAIIALLVSILVPALSSAREMARKVYCQTNMRTMGMGILQYAGDFNDFVPPAAGGQGMQDAGLPDPQLPIQWWWADFIVPYFDTSAVRCRRAEFSVAWQPVTDADLDGFWNLFRMRPSKIFNCPTITGPKIESYWKPINFTMEYMWNCGHNNSDKRNAWGYNIWYPGYLSVTTPLRMSQIKLLQNYCASLEVAPTAEMCYSPSYYYVSGALWAAAAPHLKTVNGVYMDGHVGSFTAAFMAAYDSSKDPYPFYSPY